MNILECTITMKQQTREHYERMAETVHEAGLKQLFTLLAASEGEYIEKLKVLKNRMDKVGSITYDMLEESVCVYKPHIDVQQLAEALKDDPDAYRHVVREEEDTIEFFDQLKDQAENEQMKRVFQVLADRERDHLKALENIYFFMEEPRSFLEWGEFSNLKRL